MLAFDEGVDFGRVDGGYVVVPFDVDVGDFGKLLDHDGVFAAAETAPVGFVFRLIILEGFDCRRDQEVVVAFDRELYLGVAFG